MSNPAMSSIFLYWDESHIWGLLAWRALARLGLPLRVVSGADLAGGALAREGPALLVVPGGAARRKFEALGAEGVAAVRGYLEAGGNYLGFCGGAGLGLTGPYGLGLCPWKRRAFTDRLQHFVSGHVRGALPGAHELIPPGLPASPLLPVWWPARFEAEDNGEVTVLAAYAEPGPDFWVADLPLRSIPQGPLEDLETQYGLRIWPHFMAGQPCVVAGRHGAGRYVLSYSHLETPASPDANAWLAHILAFLAGAPEAGAEQGAVPAWDLDRLPLAWGPGKDGASLFKAKATMQNLMAQGQEHHLLFRRTPWLLGWRRGLPGAALSSLYALVCQALALTPGAAALEFWSARREEFSQNLELFAHGLTGYLLAERLSATLSEGEHCIPADTLRAQREALFGPAMSPGGLFGPLLADVDGLLLRLLRPTA
jgi:hypothetical protein